MFLFQNPVSVSPRTLHVSVPEPRIPQSKNPESLCPRNPFLLVPQIPTPISLSQIFFCPQTPTESPCASIPYPPASGLCISLSHKHVTPLMHVSE